MTCAHCNQVLNQEEMFSSVIAYDVPLCSKHHTKITALLNRTNTPVEALQLFYALRSSGAKPMLEWWDGDKYVDIALSRAQINIEIYSTKEELQANEIAQALLGTNDYSQSNFTTIQISTAVIKESLTETVSYILELEKKHRDLQTTDCC